MWGARGIAPEACHTNSMFTCMPRNPLKLEVTRSVLPDKSTGDPSKDFAQSKAIFGASQESIQKTDHVEFNFSKYEPLDSMLTGLDYRKHHAHTLTPHTHTHTYPTIFINMESLLHPFGCFSHALPNRQLHVDWWAGAGPEIDVGCAVGQMRDARLHLDFGPLRWGFNCVPSRRCRFNFLGLWAH